MKKALTAAEEYYEKYGRPMLHEKFPEYEEYIAAGLAGEGSDCFGYDDEISIDHDYGTGFCIWLPEEQYQVIGGRMQKAYEELLRDEPGEIVRRDTPEGTGRLGVTSVERFYYRFLGRSSAPEKLTDWFRVPEKLLASAVNGRVFSDPCGQFTEIREKIRDFYPKDVLLKKIAARAFTMGQAGQYNYPRSVRRGDRAACYFARSEFIKAAVSMWYLLNRKYMPYYKWAFRGLDDIAGSSGMKDSLYRLIVLDDLEEAAETGQQIIEGICETVIKELAEHGCTSSNNSFMVDQAAEIMKEINDDTFAKMPPGFDFCSGEW